MLAAAAACLASRAPAQTTPSTAAPGGQAPAAFGVVGTNYTDFTFGEDRRESFSPSVIHDYDFTYNQSVFSSELWGLDSNVRYDYAASGARGHSDHRQEVLAGTTAYMLQSWGKPFVSADAGYAWQRAGVVARKSFADDFTGGVEFQVLRQLAVSPFVEYQSEPHLWNDIRNAFFPDRQWDYGVKATYRFTPQWGVSAGLQMDQFSRDDWGYRLGVNFHF